MAGRKATPIEIHKLQGTHRKHRHGTATGTVTDYGAPTMPEWLSPGARAIWAEFAPLLCSRRVLTLADSAALQLFSETLCEWRQLTLDLAIEGMTYECKTEAGATMRRPNPKASMRSDAQRRLTVIMAELGLSPASRGRIGTVTDPKATNKFANLDSPEQVN